MIPVGDFKSGRFTYTAADGTAQSVPIDFNPATLEYSIALNTQGEGGQTQQAAGAASAKLSLELLFDSTDTGEDVRRKTNLVERLLQPQPPQGGADGPPLAPPMVTFEWGAFTFSGVVDSFKQTMDFFSANGVPLRAAVSLTMSQPNYQFDQQARDGADGRATVDQAFVLPGGNPSALAAAAGDPFGARVIASVNGLESLRAEAGGSIAVGGGVTIGAAAGFSAGGGAGAGFGLGVSGGVSLGGSASAGFGGGASAGVGANAGAFAGLHAAAGATGGKYLAPGRLLAASSAPAITSGALFDVTGKAVAQHTSAFKAEVGTNRGLRFDEK